MSVRRMTSLTCLLPWERKGVTFSVATRRLACVLTALLGGWLDSPSLLAQQRVPDSVYNRITTAFGQGLLADAEQDLRLALRQHPREARALSLMGVVLDAQKRFEEARQFYAQALALDPGSAAVQNNLGNHYVARGMRDEARAAFLRVLAIDPRHPNANLQLAQINVAQRNGRTALRYLDRLPPAEQQAPVVQLLRARGMYLGGQKSSADALMNQLEKQAATDSQLAFSLGMVFVDWERFSDAERTFSLALKVDPANFDILYNLGMAAVRAGHLEHAQETLQAALRQRPQHVDSLVGLARVHVQQNQDEIAVPLLLLAQRSAQERTDIPLLLAQCSEKLGFYQDTAAAYDRYLKFKPGDAEARRERGFALVRSGKAKEGIPDLQWYVEKHPRDAGGLYQLALAELTFEREKAIQHLTQALAIKPGFLPARFARAVVHYQEGQPHKSIEDLEYILRQVPDNVRALDQLGQCYLLLDRPQEASAVLSRAAKLAPKDPATLIHYSQALKKLGQKDEASRVLAQIRQLASDEIRQHVRSGWVDYVKLSREDQKVQYLARLERSLASSPEDPALRLHLGKALFADGKPEQALAIFRQIPELTSDAKILFECGTVLIEHQQYAAAKKVLERARNSDPSAVWIRLDLALAIFHATAPEAGLRELDQMPGEDRSGDYFLLRAQVLDALGRPQEAGEALNQAFKTAPTRSDLYFQAALFLIKYDKNDEALDLLRQASRLVPNSRELMLVRAVLLEMIKQPEEAKKLLAQMQSRWPEWGLPYLIHGIILQTRLFFEEAKFMLEAAIALGENDAVAHYYLALATQNATPDDTEGLNRLISKAIDLSPEDPHIRTFAGQNTLRRKDYTAAIEHLMIALRYKPDLVEAHYALSAAYRGSGNHRKAADALNEAQRLEEGNKAGDPAIKPIRDLLFTVRPPARGVR